MAVAQWILGLPLFALAAQAAPVFVLLAAIAVVVDAFPAVVPLHEVATAVPIPEVAALAPFLSPCLCWKPDGQFWLLADVLWKMR